MAGKVFSRSQLLPVLAAIALSIGLLSCGGGDGGGNGGGDGNGGGGGDRSSHAEEIAACTEDAGFDPTLSAGAEKGATAIDLTTETATIVLQVFESERDAADYEPASGLDTEQVGSVVILGGAIPDEQRAKIKSCISGD
jgi:hypothetical protein